MKCDYEVCVIGGGPGGYSSAILSAQAGKKTCLIENDKLGGTCLNVGCIPTKTLIKSVSMLDDIRNSERFAIDGVDVSRVSVNMNKLQLRRERVTKQLVGGISGLLRGNKVDLITGKACFKDTNTVTVNGERTVTSEAFIIATGSMPIVPNIRLSGDCHVLSSTDLLMTETVPQSLAIIGAGVIGIEFAYIMSKLGSKVKVIELADNILPSMDAEITSMLQKHMETDGVEFYLGAKLQEINGNKLHVAQGGDILEITAEQTLLSVGRRPNVEDLNCETLLLSLENGAITCGNDMRTSVKNIYAVGDVNGKSMLASTALREAQVAVDNICEKHSTMRYDRIPNCVHIHPEVAGIGLTEAQATEEYGDGIKVGRFPICANGRSVAEGETDGVIKVIADSEFGEVIGVHMMGMHVTEMLSEIAVAMEAEASAEEILRIIRPHPSVNEAIGEAFMSCWKGKSLHSM